MANIEFDDENNYGNQRRRADEQEGLTGWLQSTFNLGKDSAKKVLIAIGVITFVISLFFWFQFLF